MEGKHYIVGIATAVLFAGAIYFGIESNKLRGESIVGSTSVDDVTVRVIKQDRKFLYDDYRIEILDSEGNIQVQFQGIGHEFKKGKIKSEDGLERIIKF